MKEIADSCVSGLRIIKGKAFLPFICEFTRKRKESSSFFIEISAGFIEISGFWRVVWEGSFSGFWRVWEVFLQKKQFS